MSISKFLTALALISLSACVPTTGTGVSGPPPSANLDAGLAPPSGRTSAERQARKDYYRGPRGDEF